MTLDENAEGVLKHVGNEVLNDSTVEDPSAYRGGAPSTQRSLIKFSGDILDGLHRDEVVLIQFKQTEGPDNQLRGRGGEFYLGLKKEDAGSTDDAMIDVLTATVRDGFHFRLPIYAPNLGGVAGAGSRVYSPDRRWCWNYQNDGSEVMYDTHNSEDESTWTWQWARRKDGHVDSNPNSNP